MGARVSWYIDISEDSSSWDRFLIKRAATETGSYTTIATINAKDSLGNWITSYWDVEGFASDFYKIQPYDSVSDEYGTESVSITGEDAIGYISVTEARILGKFQPSEYSDEALEMLILDATDEIDEITGRTWKGIQTVTDEYYDGENTNFLQLKKCDITSVDKIEISDCGSTYTELDLDAIAWGTNGFVRIKEYEGDVAYRIFPKGIKNNRVSYKYGNASPSRDVKKLVMLLLYRRLRNDEVVENEIEREFKRLTFKRLEMC
jgi:hypothetical protein